MTTIAPPRPDTSPVDVDELERLLDAAVPCEAEEVIVGDEYVNGPCPNAAEWRLTAPCCGASINLCTPHTDGFRNAQGSEWCVNCRRPIDLTYRRL